MSKLLSSDPWMGRAIIFLLGIYVCIHIFKLEMYPMYMFAMYSKKEIPRETYEVYKIYNKTQEIAFEDWDFRNYTFIMNTISQYDGILKNQLRHPEAQAIDKFMDKTHIKNRALNTKTEQMFTFSERNLKLKFGTWLSDELEVNIDDLIVIKEVYNWHYHTPKLLDKTLIYGLNQ